MLAPDYYYVIVGGGLAGLQLANRLSDDLFFDGKKIAIIDPEPKTNNDKTWCFWEKSPGNWDDLVHRRWEKGKFITSDINEILDLDEYSYKMLRSIDFYKHLHEKLRAKKNITFIKDSISKIDSVTMKAIGKKRSYTATHFFDSRPTEDYKIDKKTSLIFQHFKGWIVKVEKPAFSPQVFTMMDYRISYKDATSFTYVLPLSETEALVEHTFFTPFLTDDKTYNELLTKYLQEVLKLDTWEVKETEQGVIPMTDYPFDKENTAKITKIGTGGGWVKASSGYSFKSCEKKVDQLINNIKNGYMPGKNLIRTKFRKYDAIFLDVLHRRNDLGEKLFTQFYTKNSPEEIFRFLDEETSFTEELKIMGSMFHPEFLKSFFRKM